MYSSTEQIGAPLMLRQPHPFIDSIQIQKYYNKSSQLQQKYEFPRSKLSISSSNSIISQSLQNDRFYNLHLQNKNKLYEQRIVDKSKQTDRRNYKKSSVSKNQGVSQRLILQINRIKQVTKKKLLCQRQRLKLLCKNDLNKKNNQNFASTQKIQIFSRKKFYDNNERTPERSLQTRVYNSHTKSKSKNKLKVYSAKKISDVSNFKLEPYQPTVKRKLICLSKQKPTNPESFPSKIF